MTLIERMNTSIGLKLRVLDNTQSEENHKEATSRRSECRTVSERECVG